MVFVVVERNAYYVCVCVCVCNVNTFISSKESKEVQL